MSAKPVKWIGSHMAGAPVLSGTAGALIAVLDAFVNGFNLITLDSLAVAGNVLTGTKAGHGFIVNQVVLTAGANESQLNDEWVVTSVSGNTFSADATGISNVTGTGVITAKSAPVGGWIKEFSGTNLAVYKSTAVGSSGCRLRVDDTGTTTARVIGYETMTDVNTGVGPFPTEAQQSGGTYWYKSSTATSAARTWVMAGDGLAFYLQRMHNLSGMTSVDGFGDYVSEKVADGFNCFLSGSKTTSWLSTLTSWALVSGTQWSATPGSVWGPRSYTQVGGAVDFGAIFPDQAGMVMGSGQAGGLTYPSPISNGLVLSKACLREGVAIRCLEMPGIYHTPMGLPLTHLDVVTGVFGLDGRKMLAVSAETSNQGGRVFFDLTGPWR